MIDLVESLLKYEGISYTKVTDIPLLMRYTKGKCNPNGLVGVQPHLDTSTILFNIYDAVEWINVNGMRRV